MNRKLLILFPVMLLCLSGVSYAQTQNWSGILDPSRAINWTQAGVVGGIPDANWTQCGSTIVPWGATGHESGDVGQSGTVNTTTGSPTVTYVSGSPFQTYWSTSGANLILIHQPAPTNADFEYHIASVAGNTITLTTNITTGGSGVTFKVAGSLDGAYVSNLLSGCSANTYVFLGPGTYNLGSTINVPSNHVLRGSGANQTFLVSEYSLGCDGQGATVCFSLDSSYFRGAYNHMAAWTGGYSQGATSITLSNLNASLSNGQFIYLDQQNDLADNGSFFVCGTTEVFPNCSTEGEAGAGRDMETNSLTVCTGAETTPNPPCVYHSLSQNVQVVSGCSPSCTGAGPFTITITPGLYGTYWNGSKFPGAWWAGTLVTNAGVENLSIDNTGNTTGADFGGVVFGNAANDWIKGIRSVNSQLNHVFLAQSTHITVQDSYFYGTKNSASESYGIETWGATDCLILNNIFQRIAASVMHGEDMGSVTAYNFSINDYIHLPQFMSASIWEHDAGVSYTLSEGNIGAGVDADSFHGTGGLNTYFRNRFTGNECTSEICTANGNWPLQFRPGKRMENVIGNVLGTTGVHVPSKAPASYQNTVGQTAIYFLGGANSEGCDAPISSISEVGNTVTIQCGDYPVGGNGTWYTVSGVPVPGLNGVWQAKVVNQGAKTIQFTSHTSGFTAASGGKAQTVVGYDPLVASTMLRWGNYDTVAAATRWCGNPSDPGWSTTCASTPEVPTGLSQYANAVPSSTTLPASFYYSSTPSWWPSGKPWPPIGPDVTDGNLGLCNGGSYPYNLATSSPFCASGTFTPSDAGGHANSNPAMDCYLTTMAGPPDGSGAALSFNANACYSMAPAPPRNLAVIIQ